jgi:lysophospholipase L1-like esterase
VILCVGDSHTYGAGLDAKDSYPAQLETALSRRHPSHEFHVLNLGVPGLNSAKVAARLEQNLLQWRPDLVVVWVGHNNTWNVSGTEEDDPWTRSRRILLHSRLFRLLTILWHNREEARIDEHDRDRERLSLENAIQYAPEFTEPDRFRRWLTSDLERIVETATAYETPVIFITYPWKRSTASPVISEVGTRLEIPVIDSQAIFAGELARGLDRFDLVVLSAGPHPSAHLYARIVEELLPQVEASLADRL